MQLPRTKHRIGDGSGEDESSSRKYGYEYLLRKAEVKRGLRLRKAFNEKVNVL